MYSNKRIISIKAEETTGSQAEIKEISKLLVQTAKCRTGGACVCMQRPLAIFAAPACAAT